MLPRIDISRLTSYAPLTISQQSEYHINVKAIKINNKIVPLNSSLITPTKVSLGRVKLFMIALYTILEHSIFNAFNKDFVNELKGVPQVKPIQSFRACFDSRKMSFTKMEPVVPNVDLVMQNNGVWMIHGTNSMIQARPKMMCLGFVDGGVRPRDSIVVGTLQMEDNLL